ncbi:Alkaline ceramidase 3 [Boothiomyces macroporosus]|uniref:Alkaline ceramidase 3 n=1 Tax=Boothiomyces macroporosus TaxID=261099 RepID=A0AAD5UD46_9FUNG|nr:Alkaline ceramidase 3 [Boothiomyces macroporosus]
MFLAEYYNSLSSLAMAFVGLLGCYLHPWAETRFKVAFLCTSVVGLGSVAFHGTLSKFTQALDEVPMLYSALAFTYITMCQRYKLGLSLRRLLAVLLVLHAAITTYLTTAFEGEWQFTLFHISFASGEVFALYQTIIIYRKHKQIAYNRQFTRLFELGIGMYALAFACWFTDMLGCEYLEPAYGHSVTGFNPQFHALWHVCVSIGLYLMAIFALYDRMSSRLFKNQLGIGFFGMIPFIRLNVSPDNQDLKQVRF